MISHMKVLLNASSASRFSILKSLSGRRKELIMSSSMRAAIIKVFSTKHSLTLPASALKYIESVLLENDIPGDEWVAGLEFWAREYLRGDDPSSLVSQPALQRAYEVLQMKGADQGDGDDPSEVNIESHFKVIDAFDMPVVRYDAIRNTFAASRHKASIAGPPSSKAQFLRERWALMKQIVLRNENFTPPILGGHDRADYLKLTSIRNLLGRAGQLFLLFGMLSRDPEGKLCLEDGEGLVVLDMEDAVPGEGLFTEGCMVLIEGEYTEDETVRVLAMGHPPSEKRDIARGIFGHVDFHGGGAMSLKEEEKFKPVVLANEHVSFVILSDVWLDHPQTFGALEKLFQGYAEAAEFRPMVFVFCGNFAEKGWEAAGGIPRYTAGFNALADLIVRFPTLSQSSHFVFVPGPTDPWTSSALPRDPIPPNFTERLRQRVPKARFVSNPCRLQYFAQEVVIFREDLMGRMLRNTVGVKTEAEGVDMKRYLVQTILDQTHLSPLPLHVRPTMWEYDHCLRLYPMPTAIILADRYERYELTYEGCHVFNPGSFVGNEFEWSMYYPATQRSERSALPADD